MELIQLGIAPGNQQGLVPRRFAKGYYSWTLSQRRWFGGKLFFVPPDSAIYLAHPFLVHRSQGRGPKICAFCDVIRHIVQLETTITQPDQLQVAGSICQTGVGFIVIIETKKCLPSVGFPAPQRPNLAYPVQMRPVREVGGVHRGVGQIS